MNMTSRSQLDDHPIVSWTTPAFCLPAVTHVYRAPRHDQIVPMTEKHVAARKHQAPALYRRQIYFATNLFQTMPVLHDLAIDAQPRYATIGINPETQMSKTLVVFNRKRILGVAFELRRRQYLDPVRHFADQ